MLVNSRYGYFVDELYCLACSYRWARGDVDQSPLIAVVMWVERVTLGDSLHALRFRPVVADGLSIRRNHDHQGRLSKLWLRFGLLAGENKHSTTSLWLRIPGRPVADAGAGVLG